MQELIDQVITHLRGMWHRRWIGLAAAWVAAIIGIAVVYRIPDRYEASARVYVDTESLLRPLLTGLAVQPNVQQQVALMSRTLISRPNVEKLVRAADLDLTVKTPDDRDDLIDRVMRSIKLDGGIRGSPNLYVISYRDPEPARARKVVQSLLSIFVESTLGDKRQDTQTAVKFLDEQIKRYEETLRASEDRLKAFRLKYLGISSKSGTDYFARAAQLQSDIEAARLDVQSAEHARDAYKEQLETGIPATQFDATSAAASALTSPAIDERLAKLKSDLDNLLLKYTEQHPDVTSTRRLIAELEEERKRDIETRRKALAAKGPAAADGNPVLQQFKIALAQSEATVASAKAKLAGLEGQYRTLKTQAQLVPEIEAEHTQLTRDYDVQKKTYESLLARRESAMMGRDVQDTGGAQFRVIDPPRVSPDPVAPGRIALLGIACGIALLIGLFGSFLASQIMPTVHDARSLREVSKRPILGMVSLLPSGADRRIRRRSRYLFAGALSGLFAAFAAVFAFALLVARAA